MVVEISSPIFKCPDDEAVFLSRVHGVSGYESLIGTGSRLRLTLNSPDETKALTQIQEICDMWHTTFTLSTTE
ncbi:MAG: hypothetical protein DHS20C12_16790 [Pseudohongiella sp.]|nr:MAG: hypothetical protein DHS20C12_16790 [Pseudohongiella sp.]